MIVCTKCKAELADGTKFCYNCGAKLPEAKVCPNCGTIANPADIFCSGCGSSLTPVAQPVTEPLAAPSAEQFTQPVAETVAAPVFAEATAASAVTDNVPPVAEAPTTYAAPFVTHTVAPAVAAVSGGSSSGSKKKLFVFGGIGLAVVALIVVAVILFTTMFGSTGPVYGLYIKDKEIYYTDLSDGYKPWQITSEFYDSDDIDNSTYASLGLQLGRFTYTTDDGSLIFYPDKMSENDDGVAIYYRNVKDPQTPSFKIDTNIKYYHVNDDASLVTYLKDNDDDGYDLYQYTLETDTKEKLASNVYAMVVSNDGSKVIYSDCEKNIYVKTVGGDKEKLASEYNDWLYTSDDLNTIYYTKENNLYKQIIGEDRVKIADDIIDAFIYDSGAMYYLKSGTSELNLSNYLDDDLKASDAALKEPVYPTYPSYQDYYKNGSYDWDAYDLAVDKYNDAVDAYYDVYYEYQNKKERDELRADLESKKLEFSSNKLYYFDGENETLITESYGDDYLSYDISYENPVMIYETYDLNAASRVKMSAISSVSDLENKVEDAISKSVKYNVAVNTTSQTIEHKNVYEYSFEINGSGSKIYYVVLPEQEEDATETIREGELYCMTIDDGAIVGTELYDEDVYYYVNFITDDKLLYYKDYNYEKDTGDLYCNKAEIDYDVYSGYYSYNQDNDMLVYLTDVNTEKGSGSLKMYADGTSTKIADDAFVYFNITADGRILYLIDYSVNYYRGTMYMWDNNEKIKIDDDVSSIVLTYDNETQYRGDTDRIDDFIY